MCLDQDKERVDDRKRVTFFRALIDCKHCALFLPASDNILTALDLI